MSIISLWTKASAKFHNHNHNRNHWCLGREDRQQRGGDRQTAGGEETDSRGGGDRQQETDNGAVMGAPGLRAKLMHCSRASEALMQASMPLGVERSPS